ncbi:MAG: hypothetical protein AAB533_01350 [Patescibacteria group bacterium]
MFEVRLQTSNIPTTQHSNDRWNVVLLVLVVAAMEKEKPPWRRFVPCATLGVAQNRGLAFVRCDGKRKSRHVAMAAVCECLKWNSEQQ